jgi:LysR family glycine cleavage system transcriptional activator
LHAINEKFILICFLSIEKRFILLSSFQKVIKLRVNIMMRPLPSMVALSCFEAAAKHQSFTKAAEELCLTQSAVSRQVKKLEQLLGCVLFDRVKQRLYLSKAGKQYQREVSQSLTQLESATNTLRKKISGRLQIGIECAMTIHWLIPKLTDFQ